MLAKFCWNWLNRSEVIKNFVSCIFTPIILPNIAWNLRVFQKEWSFLNCRNLRNITSTFFKFHKLMLPWSNNKQWKFHWNRWNRFYEINDLAITVFFRHPVEYEISWNQKLRRLIDIYIVLIQVHRFVYVLILRFSTLSTTSEPVFAHFKRKKLWAIDQYSL